MEERASGYRESPAWRKGYFLLPYHQEQILAIYLEGNFLWNNALILYEQVFVLREHMW